MDKFPINVNSEQKEPIEVVVREGQAKEIKDPKSTRTVGVITNPAEYFTVQEPESIGALVEYSYEKGFVKLYSDYKCPFTDIVEGQLKTPKVIEELGIENQKKFSNKTLYETLKKFRMFFADQTEYIKCYNSLKNFSAKIETIVEDTSNDRGKTKKLLEKSVSSEIPESFVLKTPLFIGEDSLDISVEIFYEATNSGVEFFLESMDYQIQKEEQSAVIIDRELELIDSGVVKLHVY